MQVVKRDGSIEKYDEQKIARVVSAAGLAADESQALARGITAWLEERDQETIPSLEIRDRVLIELTKANERVADFFAWYQHTKDKA